MGTIVKNLSPVLIKALSKVMRSTHEYETNLLKSFWKDVPQAKPKEVKTLADKLSNEQKETLENFGKETGKNFKDFSPY